MLLKYWQLKIDNGQKISDQMKTKIFYLTTDSKIGGTERMLLTLIRGMNKEKYDVFLCALKPGGPLIKEAEKIGIKGICSKNPFEILGLLKKYSPDILHTFLFHSNILGRVLGRILGIPVIISSQRSVDKWRKPWHSFVDKWTSGLCNLIISNSEAGRRILIEREKISPKKIITIHNGIEIDKFAKIADIQGIRNSFGFAKEDFVIGIIANLRKVKGHKYLFEAFRQVSGLQKAVRVKLLVVGEGSLRTELELLAKNLQIGENVIFTGFRDDIPEILKAIDVLILSSLWEGFPVSILEAMASSKAVIASNVGGVPEAVVDGVTGFLVLPENAEVLSRAIIRLVENRQLLIDMEKAGLDRVQQYFSNKVMIEKTEEVYDGFRKIIEK